MKARREENKSSEVLKGNLSAQTFIVGQNIPHECRQHKDILDERKLRDFDTSTKKC